jgi:hypothetical protein
MSQITRINKFSTPDFRGDRFPRLDSRNDQTTLDLGVNVDKSDVIAITEVEIESRVFGAFALYPRIVFKSDFAEKQRL